MAADTSRGCSRKALGTASRLIALTLCLAALALGGAAEARAAVQCGDTITTNVRLTTNLVCPGTGLVVLTDGLTINLAGHTLAGAPGAGTGIFIGAANVTIENGTIRGFGLGSDVSGPPASATFLRMTFTGNGVGLSGSSATVTLSSSTVVSSAGIGVDVDGSLTVSSSRVTRNGGDGIFSINGGARITDSLVSENGGFGIIELNQGLSLVHSVLNKNDVYVQSPFGDTAFFARNVFRNSTVIVFDQVTVVDGGGNRGNNCGPALACRPL